MIRKTFTLTLITLFMLMGVDSMAQGKPFGQTGNPSPFGPTETGPVLYNQNIVSAGGWLNSSEYTDAGNLTKTAMGADDFDVPAGGSWEIGKIAFPGYWGYQNVGGAGNVNIRFFADDNGMPGTEIYSFLDVTPSYWDEQFDGNYTATYGEVEISPSITLTEGKYWVSCQVITDFTVQGDWGWGLEMNNPWVGEKLHWINPLDGWGQGASNWVPGDWVLWFGPFDQSFALYEPSKDNDLAATGVSSPVSAEVLTATESITMELKNEGALVQTGFDVAYILNGGTAVVENVGSLSLNPEETTTYTFSTTADMSIPGIFNIQVITMLSNDEIMENDTALQQVYHYGDVYVMTDGVNITTCSGTFTDPGGLYNDFDQNDKATMTIYPGTPGDMVRLNFVAFDVTWSDFYIHDGTNTDAPLLGYWQDDDNPGIVTALNTTGALTIDFEAPGWDQAFGWEAIISCYDKPDDDFAITEFTKSTSLVYTDLEMEFTATVRNLGAIAQSKTLSFYVDGNLIGTANTGVVQPTEYATVSVSHTFLTEGTVTADVTLPDDNGDNPANNSSEMTFDVYLIDTFVEFFEQETFPPDYWSVTTQYSSWKRQTSSGFPYNNSLGCAQAYVGWGGTDTLVTPQLYINYGDFISVMLKTSLWWPGELKVIWKDANTGVWTEIEKLTPTMNFENYQVDISAAAGLNYLAFVAMCEDPWAWGGELTLDDVIGISPLLYFVDEDIQLRNMQGTATPAVNDPTTYTVDMKNIGMNTVMYNSYSVKLMQKDPNGDVELTSSIGLTTTHLQQRVYNLTHSFQASGEYDIYAVVDYNADMDVNNDTTNTIHIWVQVSGTEEIEVGTEDEWDYWMPTRTSSNFSISQTIYPEAMIGATGALTGLKYFYTNNNYGPVTEIPIQLYIGTTTESYLGTYQDPANMTLVYNDTVDFTEGSHEFYIPFSVPMNYTGENIVAYMYQHHDGWKQTVDFAMHYVDDTLGGWSTSFYYINPMLPDSGTTCNKELMIPVTHFFMNTAGFGEITGTVYDENGNPFPGVDVTIDGTTVTSVTDQNGVYFINEILAGSRSLTATVFEYEDNTQSTNISAGTVNHLDFTMALKPRVDVSGTVVGNDDPQNFLEDALIEMWGYANFQSATDENGEFLIPSIYGNETYSVKVSKHGFAPYFDNSVVVADGNLDLGTIVLDELMSTPYSVYAQPVDAEVTLDWKVPNTGFVQDYNYDLAGNSGWMAEPYEHVWLGNIYETVDRGTITAVEAYFVDYLTFSGEVTLDILDADGNVVMSSEPFMTEKNTWMNIEIPDVFFEGTFYAMIHWDGTTESTDFLGSEDTEYSGHGPNYAYIMYPGEEPSLLETVIGKYSTFEIIVHTLNEQVTDGGNRQIDGYNVYRGLLSDVHNSSTWAPISGSPVADTVYTDATWPPTNAGDYVYAIEAVYTTGESILSFSNPVNYTPVGVDELSDDDVRVYPNPARDILYIENCELGTAVVYSVTGQVMGEYRITDQRNNINVSSFNSGLYIIKIVGDNNEVTSMKFFKN